jgi:hypothetical protein
VIPKLMTDGQGGSPHGQGNLSHRHTSICVKKEGIAMTLSSKGIRRGAVVGALVVGVGTCVAAAAPAATAAPFCGIYWGSLPKTAKITETAPMMNVRAGQHACFDRMVVDVRAGGADGYFVHYVDTVRQEGSGFAVPLRGGARLQVTVVAPAYDNYRQTYHPANRSELVNVAGWQTFRQIVGRFLRGTVDHRTRRPGKVAVPRVRTARPRCGVKVRDRCSAPLVGIDL